MATLKSVKTWLGLFSLSCALFGFGCAHDDDSSNDPSEHHHHHGGGGHYGRGQGAMFTNPSGSASPVPGD